MSQPSLFIVYNFAIFILVHTADYVVAKRSVVTIHLSDLRKFVSPPPPPHSHLYVLLALI